MRLNAHTYVRTSRLLLVPYETWHVPRYHAWMTSEELQQLTASEPLSLEEEFVMQRTWREDEDKLTFILLDRTAFEAATGERHAREQAAMIGDVNIFLQLQDDSAEVDVMLAEASARGRGLGQEAVLAVMAFGVESGAVPTKVEQYCAKIGLDNAPSLRLFSRLGFEEVARSEIFNEATLTFPRTKWETQLLSVRERIEFAILPVEEVA